MSNSDIFIWDAEGLPSPVADTVVLWRAFAQGTSSEYVSIPRLIEANADLLRARYLCWVYEVGEFQIHDRRLIDHLQLRPDFSYWWMTLIAEKSNFSKSPQINDVIRLLAFIDWASERQPNRITLVSANEPLAECLSLWCQKAGVVFQWQYSSLPSVTLTWPRRIYLSLPLGLQAFFWLIKYLSERWPLRGVGVMQWRNTPGKALFVTYTANLVPRALRQGRFESRYWAHLPDVLDEEKTPCNWLHLYVKDGLLPTAADAANALNLFNQFASGRQCHVTLDSFLGLNVVFRTLGDFLRIVRVGLRMGVALKPLPDTHPDLWPLLRADWLESMFGAPAMNNLLMFNLFETALKSLRQQKQGIYLKENISWESAFIHTWRGAGHGCLIGTPHATMRFWDLRYFYDHRSYPRTGLNDLPLPDQVTCNGPVMHSSLRDAGYPAEHLLNVEALRYLHLCQSHQTSETLAFKPSKTVRLLVLGDYTSGNTLLQMRLLQQAVPLSGMRFVITVRAHPMCPICASDFPALELKISTEPISRLLAQCDVAYASAVTSAAVDAYCAGVPTVSVLDPTILNLSPLRSCSGALFASTPHELADALSLAASGEFEDYKHKAFFTLDSRLSSWQKLFDESSVNF
jgi:surface carbohydrate biosynthesis protein (TIGR04326 family)